MEPSTLSKASFGSGVGLRVNGPMALEQCMSFGHPPPQNRTAPPRHIAA